MIRYKIKILVFLSSLIFLSSAFGQTVEVSQNKLCFFSRPHEKRPRRRDGASGDPGLRKMDSLFQGNDKRREIRTVIYPTCTPVRVELHIPKAS